MYDSNLVGRYEREGFKVKFSEPSAWTTGGHYLERAELPTGFFFKEAGKSLDQALLFESSQEIYFPPNFMRKIIEVGSFQFFKPTTLNDQGNRGKQVPFLELFHVPSRSVITLSAFYESDLLELVKELEQKPPKKRHNPEITEEDKAQKI